MRLFGFDISLAAKKRTKSAAYPSAHMNRLTEDFPILTLSADGASRFNLYNLRNRSQQLEREKGGIGERYFSCVETNVIGPDGIGIGRGRGETDSGQYDSVAAPLMPSGCAALYTREILDETGLFADDLG